MGSPQKPTPATAVEPPVAHDDEDFETYLAQEDAWVEQYAAESERWAGLTPEERSAELLAAVRALSRDELAGAGLTSEELEAAVEVSAARYAWLVLAMPDAPDGATMAERRVRWVNDTMQQAREAYDQATPDERRRVEQADEKFADPEYRRGLFDAYVQAHSASDPPLASRRAASVPRAATVPRARRREHRRSLRRPAPPSDPDDEPDSRLAPRSPGRLGVGRSA